MEKRGCRAQGNTADVVHAERGDAFLFVQGLDIHLIPQFLHDGFGLLGRVAQEVFAARIHRLLRKPADHGLDILADVGRIVRFDQHVAARDVDFVFQGHDDRLRGEGLGDFFPAGEMDLVDRGGKTRGHDADRIARLENAAGHASGITAEVVMFLGLRTDDPLHGKARIDVIFRAAGVNGLEVVKQRRTFEPRHLVRLLNHIVAIERRQRDGRDLGDIVEARGELVEVLHDAVEDGLAVVDEIHLVHRQREVADFQEVGDKGVALGLLDDALARIDENDGEVGR